MDSTRLEFSTNSEFTQQDFTEIAINNISFLKRLSDEHGQVDQALNFNAMELRAKRRKSGQQLDIANFLFWFFTCIYEYVSDFGRSFTKPLFFLGLLFCANYLLSLVVAFELSPALKNNTREQIFSELSNVYKFDKADKNEITLSAYRAAGEYSLYHFGNILDFTDEGKITKAVNMRLFGTEIEPWWMRLFGILKSILSAVLLFLTALGLRNKYRVG